MFLIGVTELQFEFECKEVERNRKKAIYITNFKLEKHSLSKQSESL